MMVGPGDVLLTRGTGWVPRLIRLDAAAVGKPTSGNHIAVLHHRDHDGTWWAIEGRPQGIGWADARRYLDSRETITNVGQPKTDRQRQEITAAAERMLGVTYDWRAVLTDALMVAHLQSLTNRRWRTQAAPGHVVCSSLAAYLYHRAGLDHPTDHKPRYTTPADWEDFITRRGYAQPTTSRPG